MENLEHTEFIEENAGRNRQNRRNVAGPLSGTKPAHSEDAMRSIRRRLNQYEVTAAGCWQWTGYVNQHGYGRMLVTDGGRNRLLAVHRLAYESWVGDIEDGKVIMHTCDNRACINPDHLAQGSQAKNLKDARVKGRNRGSKRLVS